MSENKLYVIFFFLLFFCFSSCGKEPLPSEIIDKEDNGAIDDKYSYETLKLFQLSTFGIAPFSNNAQGMDIYNDMFLFQAGTNQNTIHIIDLEKSTALGTVFFITPNGESCHMNNINCGEKLNDDDIFPTIYLSQTNKSRACFVLRISNEASSYDLIQTITYSGKKHYRNNCAFDWFIDLNNKYIYTYGQYNGDPNKREIMKFHLPSLDYESICFSDDEIIDSFILDDQSIYQGSRIINGLLYTPVGYGNKSHPGRLIVIDLDKKKVVKDGPISVGEPEAIGQYQNGAMISSGGRNPSYYYLSF